MQNFRHICYHIKFITLLWFFGIYSFDISKPYKNRFVHDQPWDVSMGHLKFQSDDYFGAVEFRLRLPEFNYRFNTRLLNDNDDYNQFWFARYIFDVELEFDSSIISARCDIRSECIWGDQSALDPNQTTPSVISEDDLFGQTWHRHAVPRCFMWLRRYELEIGSDISLTIGSFPYQLGRGISLGFAYQLDAHDPTYFLPQSVSQYPFGIKLSGDLSKDFAFELYYSVRNDLNGNIKQIPKNILNLSSESFSNGGFSWQNYIIASRFQYKFERSSKKSGGFVEPYGLFYNNPQTYFLLPGDTHAFFSTFGCAGEFYSQFSSGNRIEFGFDTAFNFGTRLYRATDLNFLVTNAKNGFAICSNIGVFEIDFSSSPLAPCSEKIQPLVDGVRKTTDNNAHYILNNIPDIGELFNSPVRFTGSDEINLNGSMMVFDFGYFFKYPNISLNGTFAFSSGDGAKRNGPFSPPDYKSFSNSAFEGINQFYFGDRVKNYYVIGAAAFPRTSLLPVRDFTLLEYESLPLRFSNLIFTGGSLRILGGLDSEDDFKFSTSLISYWNATQIKLCPNVIFEKTRSDTHLGTELNFEFAKNIFSVTEFGILFAMFFPGRFFTDLKCCAKNLMESYYLDPLILKRTTTAFDVDLQDYYKLLGDSFSFLVYAYFETKF